MKRKLTTNNCLTVWLAITIGISLVGCQKYLDVKSNINLDIPSTIEDLQAILNNNNDMNTDEPNTIQAGTDEYYLTLSTYNTLSTNAANYDLYYTWNLYATGTLKAWPIHYGIIQQANTVLDYLPKVSNDGTISSNTVKGTALFFRGWEFWELAQTFSPVYDSQNINNPYGIVLRLTSDISVKSVRATVGASYNQLINDLKQAALLLPKTTIYPTQPSKAAAYGALARAYLSMQDYANAKLYADSCLAINNNLIDFNTLSASSTYPFSGFNQEMLIYFKGSTSSLLEGTRANVDSDLYNSYSSNDLRKTIYFKRNSNGTNTYGFYGSYTGSGEFMGLATDEIYLIKAECEARLNDAATNYGLDDLNALLQKRWVIGTLVPYTATTATEALNAILLERKKELFFRGVRWSDLKRLNLDPSHALTLVRNVNGQTYTLPPNDLRYELLIDETTISLSGIPQNPR